ncbi:flavin reductase family protein [Salinibacterium sp. NSLL150]|uniref:flavin reductase family protein n=1 Tax=unclassified Salinibacterium TaxID=2632331 RepID=UPI0018CCCD6A|nr:MULTISPECIES: flavin reductase family protein [unclassified Salinibacterium]MBH0022885.1 flavin reductase family protein [Salinibacterium sp. SWN248]MBH0097884.1 flavin reductase family protein [Salinibacterium sp. NSLL35]MBH0100639.1 flavin reductase family protein [Salinibacterium sp. NSLL150]MBH0103398.1 flavin reductase family protein [Salinibacterium sp. NSLL16]MBH0106159.1 flavin reductase family protein [Salinibacterium sp. NSLL17]
MSHQTTAEEVPPQVALRRALSLFPTGVVALAAVVDGAPTGIAVNSFTSVSLDPPLVAVCPARTSTTWPVLARATRIGLSVLGADQESTARSLASRTGDRFADIAWRATEGGAIHMDGAALWLECEIRNSFDGGDHEIVTLEVIHSEAFPEVTPLVFHLSQFRGL